jgi:hypothetical protein
MEKSYLDLGLLGAGLQAGLTYVKIAKGGGIHNIILA